jgi:medium-chain acyl-[acyl-carrier-protein] hydrolase
MAVIDGQTRRGNGARRVRVFCFPHAGAGASVYHHWTAAAPANVEFRAVQLPGREERLAEKPLTDLNALVSATAQEVERYGDRPFALFGHSMGALIAFELARWFQTAGGPLPIHLFVSGRRAPHLPPSRPPLHNLPPGAFETAVFDLAGTPRELLADDEFMALIGPVLRADLTLCETYQYRSAAPLEMPVTVFGGTHDREATPDELEAWRSHGLDVRGVQLFSGHHFYLRDHVADVVTAIAAAVAIDSSRQ